jgi:hypothetical protein
MIAAPIMPSNQQHAVSARRCSIGTKEIPRIPARDGIWTAIAQMMDLFRTFEAMVPATMVMTN